MSGHEEYRERLSALLDGELSDAEREETLAHLDGCEVCREYFAELTALHDAFAEAEEFDAPAALWTGVSARMHEAPAQQVRAGGPLAKKARPWRSWGALAACAAVVVLAATVIPNLRLGSANKSDAAGVSETPSACYAVTQDMAPEAAATDDAVTEDSMFNTSLAVAPTVSADAPGEPESSLKRSVEQLTGAAAEAAAERREPDLLLYGDDAEFWLWNNGVWDEAQEAYWVDRETLAALPEGLTLGTEEMLQRWEPQTERFIALVRAADAEAAG